MNNEQTIEKIVYQCGFDTQIVVALAVVLLAFCGWLLYRERHVLGKFWSAGFWLLRAIALSVLVWMFLQPTRLTETKTQLPQTVAIVVDSSGSMDVVDEDEEGQAIAWQLANSDIQQRGPQVAIDSAMLAVEVAVSKWNKAQAQIQQGFDTNGIKKTLTSVNFALTRAAKHLDQNFASAWVSASDVGQAKDYAQQFRDLADAALKLNQSDRLSAEQDFTALIQKSQDSLDRLTDTFRLAKTWSRQITNSITQDAGRETQTLGPESRRAQAVSLVNKVQGQDPAMQSTGLQVKRFTFEENLTPVSSDGPWLPTPVANTQTDEFESDADANVRSQTNLTGAMEQALQLSSRDSITSAIFLTDGGHNAAATVSPLEVAAQPTDISISFVPIGSLKPRRDIQIYFVNHPRSVSKGDEILIEARISAVGYINESINLQLRMDGELIEEKELDIESDMIDLKHSFTVPAETYGSLEFELSIDPLEDEASEANNLSIFKVAVVRDKIRILLADHFRRWEFGFLDQLLFRDKHMEHEQIQFEPRLRATGELKLASRLPITVDEWNRYEVAMLGDLSPEHFPLESQSSLVEFVRDKGGVAVLIAGRNAMPHQFAEQPLFDILPVTATTNPLEKNSYHIVANRLARTLEALKLDDSNPKSQALWKQLFQEQPITWLSDYCLPKPTARRLLDALPNDDDLSVEPCWVCWQQVGAGRVVYLSAPDSYRMRFRQGDRLHHRFWAQLLRWITSTDPGGDNGLIQLATDKTRYLQHEPIEVTAVLSDPFGEAVSDADLSVEFDDGSGDPKTFVLARDETYPGRYTGQVYQLPTGAYRVTVNGTAIDELTGDKSIGDDATHQDVELFVNVVASPSVERVNTVCDRPLMRQIAESTGGFVIPPTALAELIQLQAGEPETISRLEQQPLWNRWPFFWVALGCLFTEWIVRRKKGLT